MPHCRWPGRAAPCASFTADNPRIWPPGVFPAAELEPVDAYLRANADVAWQHKNNDPLREAHYHYRPIYDLCTCPKLLDMIDHPSVVANIDPGNMYAVADAEKIEDAVQILGPRLGYVHLKNCRTIAGGYDYSWPLDFGDIDYARGMQAIVASGYAGDYCIEYCGRGDPGVAAERDARYFRQILEEAQRG